MTTEANAPTKKPMETNAKRPSGTDTLTPQRRADVTFGVQTSKSEEDGTLVTEVTTVTDTSTITPQLPAQSRQLKHQWEDSSDDSDDADYNSDASESREDTRPPGTQPSFLGTQTPSTDTKKKRGVRAKHLHPRSTQRTIKIQPQQSNKLIVEIIKAWNKRNVPKISTADYKHVRAAYKRHIVQWNKGLDIDAAWEYYAQACTLDHSLQGITRQMPSNRVTIQPRVCALYDTVTSKYYKKFPQEDKHIENLTDAVPTRQAQNDLDNKVDQQLKVLSEAFQTFKRQTEHREVTLTNTIDALTRQSEENQSMMQLQQIIISDLKTQVQQTELQTATAQQALTDLSVDAITEATTNAVAQIAQYTSDQCDVIEALSTTAHQDAQTGRAKLRKYIAKADAITNTEPNAVTRPTLPYNPKQEFIPKGYMDTISKIVKDMDTRITKQIAEIRRTVTHTDNHRSFTIKEIENKCHQTHATISTMTESRKTADKAAEEFANDAKQAANKARATLDEMNATDVPTSITDLKRRLTHLEGRLPSQDARKSATTIPNDATPGTYAPAPAAYDSSQSKASSSQSKASTPSMGNTPNHTGQKQFHPPYTSFHPTHSQGFGVPTHTQFPNALPTTHMPRNDMGFDSHTPSQHARHQPPYNPYDRHSDIYYKMERFNKARVTMSLKSTTVQDRDINAVNFYTNFQIFAQSYGIGIKPFTELGPTVKDYYQPSSPLLDLQQQQRERALFSSAIGPKVIEAIEDDNMKTAMVQQLAGQNDGYLLMRNIMIFHVPSLKDVTSPADYAKATERPKFTTHENIFAYQARLLLFYQIQTGFGHQYSANQITNVFISELARDPRYESAVKEAKERCQNSVIPAEYELGRIAYTMASYAQSTSSVDFDIFSSATANTTDASAHIKRAEAPNKNDRSARRPPRRRRPVPDVQCSKCKTYGHLGSDCTFYPKVWWCVQEAAKEKNGIRTIAEAFRERNTPEQRNADRAAIRLAFKEATGEQGNPDTYDDDVMERFIQFEENFAEIKTARCIIATDTHNDHSSAYTDHLSDIASTIDKITPNYNTTMESQIAPDDITNIVDSRILQAVTIPPTPTFLTDDYELEDERDYNEQDTIQIQHSHSDVCRDVTDNVGQVNQIHHFQIAAPLQCDPGANRHITDDKSLISDFREITPFRIGTINKNSESAVEVTGTGLIKIPMANGEESTRVYYSRDASGSVFSPDRFVRDTPKYRKFSQVGCPSTGDGAILFYEDEDNVAATIPLYTRNGLWYMAVTKPNNNE